MMQLQAAVHSLAEELTGSGQRLLSVVWNLCRMVL